MLWIVVMICAGDIPPERCTRESARAYQAMRAPDGFVICAAPIDLAMASSGLAPAPGEYARVKCGRMP